jgi:hypothetical protein
MLFGYYEKICEIKVVEFNKINVFFAIYVF